MENAKSARAVKAKLEELSAAGVTYALIDAPPELEDLALVAAMVSDVVLVPDLCPGLISSSRETPGVFGVERKHLPATGALRVDSCKPS